MTWLLIFASAWLIGDGLGKIVGYRNIKTTVWPPVGHFTAAQIEEAGRIAMSFYATRL